jgi:hypothetical protein
MKGMKGKKCPHCGMMVKGKGVGEYDELGDDMGDDTEENDNLDTPGIQKKSGRLKDMMTSR